MINEFQTALSICVVQLQEKDIVTEASIDEAMMPVVICQGSGLYESVDLQVLKAKLMEMFHATMDHARILEGKERRVPWLKAFKAEEKSNWHYSFDNCDYLFFYRRIFHYKIWCIS